jgi:hypothetical protein
MAYDFEKRLEQFRQSDLKDLETIKALLKEGLEFLREYRIVQARGDLGQKQRMGKLAAKLKEVLLEKTDQIEQVLGMSRLQIEEFLNQDQLFKEDELTFIEEANKELESIKARSANLSPNLGQKKGGSKMKSWMRP